jgi:hypothetical protein
MNPGSIHACRTYWHAAAGAHELDVANPLIERARRDSIGETERVLTAGQQIFALNGGTGIDAVFLVNRGIRVLACDMAPRMIKLAQGRAALILMKTSGLTDFRVLATENIGVLGSKASRKRPRAAMESGQAIQDPGVRSTDDWVRLQFECIEG